MSVGEALTSQFRTMISGRSVFLDDLCLGDAIQKYFLLANLAQFEGVLAISCRPCQTKHFDGRGVTRQFSWSTSEASYQALVYFVHSNSWHYY